MKTLKTAVWAYFGPILPMLGQTNFFSGKPAYVSFVSTFLLLCRISEIKINEHTPQKVGHRYADQQTGAQTDRLTSMNSKDLPLQGLKRDNYV